MDNLSTRDKISAPNVSVVQRLHCIEQIVARPYVLCNLALAPLTVNYSVQFYFLVRDMRCCSHVLTMTTPTNITSGCNMNTIANIGVSRSGCRTLLKQGCTYTPQKVYSVRFKNYPPWGVNWGS